MNTKKFLRTLMVILAIVAGGMGLWRLKQIKMAPHAGTADLMLADYGPVADFSLTERSGKKVTLATLQGKPWIADFIFTRCAGPCPLLSLRLSELQKDYLKSSNLHFVSFTVDPEYDSPAVLRTYAAQYNADPKRWLFLTGNTSKVYDLMSRSFHLAVQKNTDPKQKPGEEVNHSLSLVLVDAGGRIRGYYAGNDLEALQLLRRDLGVLLKS